MKQSSTPFEIKTTTVLVFVFGGVMLKIRKNKSQFWWKYESAVSWYDLLYEQKLWKYNAYMYNIYKYFQMSWICICCFHLQQPLNTKDISNGLTEGRILQVISL